MQVPSVNFLVSFTALGFPGLPMSLTKVVMHDIGVWKIRISSVGAFRPGKAGMGGMYQNWRYRPVRCPRIKLWPMTSQLLIICAITLRRKIHRIRGFELRSCVPRDWRALLMYQKYLRFSPSNMGCLLRARGDGSICRKDGRDPAYRYWLSWISGHQ